MLDGGAFPLCNHRARLLRPSAQAAAIHSASAVFRAAAGLFNFAIHGVRRSLPVRRKSEGLSRKGGRISSGLAGWQRSADTTGKEGVT
jgi:hypothetical protein